ncbi:MAG: hypothetical protein IPF92_14505 [Myxococcales bacterium]|nr:hypothetical protein [Myxococcales bacterium]
MLQRTRVKVLGGGVVLGALAWVGVSGVVGACAEKKSAIMLAITTDMKAPKDVNSVSVSISTNGTVKHSFIGRVRNGEVELPATLAIVEPEEPGATIRVRVMAFQDNKPRVLRDVRTSIPKGGRTGLLRIPLNFANDGSTKSEPVALPLGDGVTTKSGNAEGFDFFASFRPDCPDPLNETWIDGACQDNEVKFESLPDFDPAALIPASGAGCFDVAKCFAGATPVGDRLEHNTKEGKCTLSPPEGGVAGLNLALVTRETGECNASGDCYVPLDRGAPGWREEGGKIVLPLYVCQLATARKARLFERRGGACASKEEKQTVCSGAPGEAPTDGGDARVDTPPPTLVAKLGFATAVAISGRTLYAAGTRVGKREIAVSGTELTDIAVPASPNPDAGPFDAGAADASTPSAPRPWRIAPVGSVLAATDGSRSYFEDPAQRALLAVPPGFAVDVAGAGGFAYWATAFGAFFSDTRENSGAFPGGGEVSAVAAVDGFALVAGAGKLELCERASGSCQPPIVVQGALFHALAFDPATAPPANFKAYALAPSGVYEIPARGQAALTAGPLPFTPAGTTGPAQQGAAKYARGLVAGAKCVYFTSSAGVEYATTGATGASGVLAPAPAPSSPALGVALGADPAGKQAVYFTVFAAEDAGGGVYRVAPPAACASEP